MKREGCQKCMHLRRLVEWDCNNDRKAYLPNYTNERECCVALILAGDNTVFGHVKGHDGMCEMFVPRGEEE